jgi:hypothetical protein
MLSFYIELLEEHLSEITSEEKPWYLLAIEALKEQRLELEDMYNDAYADSLYSNYEGFLEY